MFQILFANFRKLNSQSLKILNQIFTPSKVSLVNMQKSLIAGIILNNWMVEI